MACSCQLGVGCVLVWVLPEADFETSIRIKLVYSESAGNARKKVRKCYTGVKHPINNILSKQLIQCAILHRNSAKWRKTHLAGYPAWGAGERGYLHSTVWESLAEGYFQGMLILITESLVIHMDSAISHSSKKTDLRKKL